jgi:hypothetical protein
MSSADEYYTSESEDQGDYDEDEADVFWSNRMKPNHFYNFEVVGIDFTGITMLCLITDIRLYPSTAGESYIVTFRKSVDIQNYEQELLYTLQIRNGEILNTTIGSDLALEARHEDDPPRSERVKSVPLFVQEAYADPHIAARCCMMKDTLETRANTYFKKGHQNCKFK